MVPFLSGADGVVGSRVLWNLINHPVRSAKEAAQHFLDVAATPPQLRRGVVALVLR
jgi:hypothetical protein